MRMWMVDERFMCRKHLLGEHVEIHMLLGSIKKGRSTKGFTDKKLIYPAKIKERHDAIAHEMYKRGYKHRSDLDIGSVTKEQWEKVDMSCEVVTMHSIAELFSRCQDCYNHREKVLKSWLGNGQGPISLPSGIKAQI